MNLAKDFGGQFFGEVDGVASSSWIIDEFEDLQETRTDQERPDERRIRDPTAYGRRPASWPLQLLARMGAARLTWPRRIGRLNDISHSDFY